MSARNISNLIKRNLVIATNVVVAVVDLEGQVELVPEKVKSSYLDY